MARRNYIQQYYQNQGVVQEIKSIRQQLLQLQRSPMKLPAVQKPKNTLQKKVKPKSKTPLPDTDLLIETFFGDFLRPFIVETFFGIELPYNRMETFFGTDLEFATTKTFFGADIMSGIFPPDTFIGEDLGIIPDLSPHGFTGPPTIDGTSQSDATMEAALANGPIFVIAKRATSAPTLVAGTDCTVVTLLTTATDPNGVLCRIFYVYPTGPSPTLTKTGNFGPLVSIPGGAGAPVTSDNDESINNTNGGNANITLTGTLTIGNVAVAIFTQMRSGVFSGGVTWGVATDFGTAGTHQIGWQDSADSLSLSLPFSSTDAGTAVGSHVAGAYVEVAPS